MSGPIRQSIVQLLSMWFPASFRSKASLYFRFRTAHSLLIQLSVEIMRVCLDQNLLLAQTFTLSTKGKKTVSSKTSEVGPRKEMLECSLCSRRERWVPPRRNRKKLRFPSRHCCFPNHRGAGTAKTPTEVPQNGPTVSWHSDHRAPKGCPFPGSWWGAAVMPFCISSASPRFCRLLRMWPLFWPHQKGATGSSRGALFEVNNLYPLQEPAGPGTRIIVADPQLLQLPQVNGFDGEHVYLHRRQEANDCVSKKGGKKGSKWPRVIFFPIKK